MKILINTETGRPDNEIEQTQERYDSQEADIASGKLVWVDYEVGQDVSTLIFDPKKNTFTKDPIIQAKEDQRAEALKNIASADTLEELKEVLGAVVEEIKSTKPDEDSVASIDPGVVE